MSELSSYEVDLVRWGTPLIFFLGGVGAALIILFFHFKTYQLVKEIQRLKREEGDTWPFWNNQARLRAFVYYPASLIDEADKQQLVMAMQALVNHRKTMMKRVLQAVGVLLIFIIMAIAIPVCIALLHR